MMSQCDEHAAPIPLAGLLPTPLVSCTAARPNVMVVLDLTNWWCSIHCYRVFYFGHYSMCNWYECMNTNSTGNASWTPQCISNRIHQDLGQAPCLPLCLARLPDAAHISISEPHPLVHCYLLHPGWSQEKKCNSCAAMCPKCILTSEWRPGAIVVLQGVRSASCPEPNEGNLEVVPRRHADQRMGACWVAQASSGTTPLLTGRTRSTCRSRSSK